MTTPSILGLAAELRDLPIGGVLSRAARVPLADRACLRDWSTKATATAAKQPGAFVTQTLSAIDDTFDHAVRALVIVRVA